MSGDLQGIAGKEIIALPVLEDDEEANWLEKSSSLESPKHVRDDDDEY